MSMYNDIPDRDLDPDDSIPDQDPEFDADKYYEEKYGDNGWAGGIVRRDKTELGIVLEDIGRTIGGLENTTLGKDQA